MGNSLSPPGVGHVTKIVFLSVLLKLVSIFETWLKRFEVLLNLFYCSTRGIHSAVNCLLIIICFKGKVYTYTLNYVLSETPTNCTVQHDVYTSFLIVLLVFLCSI